MEKKLSLVKPFQNFSFVALFIEFLQVSCDIEKKHDDYSDWHGEEKHPPIAFVFCLYGKTCDYHARNVDKEKQGDVD